MSINNGSKRPEIKEKIGEASRERWKNKEYRDKIMATFTEERRKNMSERMKNGGHKHAIKFINKISKEELKLGKLVKKLHPNCEYQYSVINYDLDIALPEYKIGIEFDGYYHFHTDEAKKYFKKRRKRIEKEGWKLLSYTMYEKLPSLDKLEKDINILIEGD